MPRFTSSLMPYSSPRSGGSATAAESSSVRLSCLSPDGRSVHSLSATPAEVCIETYRLPLEGTAENNENVATDAPSLVRTRLPQQVVAALARYPAMELLCVDVDSSSQSSSTERKLPRLCLYTKRDVFLIELAYYSGPWVAETEGFVVAVEEPFEDFLLSASTYSTIVRIRQPPQRYMGYSTMCPPQSIAMLIHDSEINETRLVLYHGADGIVTTPFVQQMEQIVDMSDRITDFCFCHSNSFSLLSNTTVMLLQGSGDVSFVGPILFRGTVVSKSMFQATLEYIQKEMEQVETISPQWRQLRATERYLCDTFLSGSSNVQFLTAQARSEAFQWQVQMQGPVVVTGESDDFETQAMSIEPFDAGDLVGLAIGHVGGILEFGMISPTALIPRFNLESAFDRNELDEDLTGGAIVTRVDLRGEENEYKAESSACINLVRDPIMDSVVHYVTPTHIHSISTNMLKVVANKIHDQVGQRSPAGMFSPPGNRKELKPRTTAWPCLDVSSSEDTRHFVVGAVVSGDVQLGHVLICRLSNGAMVAVNLTDARQRHEMDALDENEEETGGRTSSADKHLQVLQDIRPLYEIIEPLGKKVTAGLGKLTKIVGSETPIEAVTPEQLVAAASIKETCDEEIMMPVLEIREHIKARKKDLAVMHHNLKAQLAAIKDSLSKLRERNSVLQEKAAVADTNALSLAQRGADLLQSTSDLMPTISQSEFNYFQELNKLDGKTKKWKQEMELLKGRVDNLQQTAYSDTMDIEIDAAPDQKQDLKTMQDACEQSIFKYRQRLDVAEEKVDSLADIAGIERDSEYE